MSDLTVEKMREAIRRLKDSAPAKEPQVVLTYRQWQDAVNVMGEQCDKIEGQAKEINALCEQQNNRAGWVRVETPPEVDKLYLLTNGRDVIPAMYQRVSYPLGDHMEWVRNGCIDTHGVTRTATHYREIELPEPPEVQ